MSISEYEISGCGISGYGISDTPQSAQLCPTTNPTTEISMQVSFVDFSFVGENMGNVTTTSRRVDWSYTLKLSTHQRVPHPIISHTTHRHPQKRFQIPEIDRSVNKKG